ncbi:50S ribosomal subunit protein L25 [Wigglesworthia glossinidia endosymbiont of Glossina morsitans morsitans (Yale colony)]|uniref:50S ribosomal protein L25 n=1 Tax=Wigglesworthia glossinidia endosymbiont of Glossina morsitans morsitans (Yale colony) TaxID=1142511 RepID=H6Q5I6_WIGGL|nr:50S ribosomal protein L25 [Wigglesworthia glossinidia]AFA41469.1 50S ribosomal subunit protein L25 [Wigglesworthia glossinidia endosymbiont of Glossina morsitans morsitans (Yale colony)]
MFNLIAELRYQVGKKSSRRTRKIKNYIPAVVYGNKKPTISIMIYYNEIANLQHEKNFYHDNICLNFQKEKKIIVKIQSIQRHVFKPKIIHIDFLYS